MIPVPKNLKVTWHGHSCFSIDNGGLSLVLDPYDPGMTGYPPLHVKAHAMLSSHQHGDHNYRAAVTLIPLETAILRQIDSMGSLPEDPDPSIFYYKAVETCHDESGGRKRGKNTIHVIKANGLTVAHLGDLGHILTTEQIAAIGHLDLLLIPVGGYYTIDAEAAWRVIGQLQPANVAPMHYQIGYGNISITTVEPFLKLCGAKWRLEELPGPVLQLESQTIGRCYIFSYKTGI